MAISVIRSFTEDDASRLDAAAQRFASRHSLPVDADEHGSIREALDACLWSRDTGTSPRVKDLMRLWQACRCRALGVSVAADVTVAHGYVGRSC